MPEFLQPTTLSQAVSMLASRQNIRVLAGGTDLLVQLREGHNRPAAILDIKHIPEMWQFAYTRQGLEIGGAVTCNEILHATFLQPEHGALQQAAAALANTLLRNRATLVGNIVNASPGGDMIPACLALNATLVTAAPVGGREIPLAEFFTGPKRHVLHRDEIVVKVVLPTAPGQSAYLKRKRIRGHDLAQVGAAGFYSADGALRIALGAVGPTPKLVALGAFAPEELVQNRAALVQRALKEASPITDVRASREYRLAMVEYLTGQLIDGFIANAREVAAG